METRGGRVHHAYGRCAPYIRNSRTIHAVPMHHHPRFCCSLGAAYALGYVVGHDIRKSVLGENMKDINLDCRKQISAASLLRDNLYEIKQLVLDLELLTNPTQFLNCMIK